MPRPYSNDLRRKIVETVASGASCRQAAGQFKVSVSFAIKLMQRVRATGDVSPAQFGGYKVSPLAAHEADLRRWVAERSEITIAELQALLLERGTRTSPAALARFLGKLGLTRKKDGESRRAGARGRRRGPAASGSDGSTG
jgi:putative transposase